MRNTAPDQATLDKVTTLFQSLQKYLKERSEFSTQFKDNKTTLPDDIFSSFANLGKSHLNSIIEIKTQEFNAMLEDLYKQYPDHEFIQAHYAAIINRLALDAFKRKGSEEHNLKALELAQKAYNIYPVPTTIFTRILNALALNLLKEFPDVDVPTIERAIEYYKKSLELIPDQEKLNPPLLVQTPLSYAYHLLFQKLNESNVEKRIDCLRAAAEYAPRTSHGADHLSTLYAFLTNTARDQQAQHNHTNAIKLLNEAYEKYNLHLTLYPYNTNFQEGMQICKLLATSYQEIGNQEMAAKYSEKSKHSTIDLSKFPNSAYSVTMNFSTM